MIMSRASACRKVREVSSPYTTAGWSSCQRGDRAFPRDFTDSVAKAVGTQQNDSRMEAVCLAEHAVARLRCPENA